MRRRAFLIALFCLYVALPCRFALARPAPQHLVECIQKTIQDCDLTGFERYVAINALVGNSLDELMQHLQTASLSGQDLPPTLAVMALAATSSKDSTLRNLLRSELGKLIRYGVSSGLLNGQKTQSVKPEGLLAPFLDKLSPGKKILRAVGKPRRDTVQPGTWLVPVEVYDVGSNGHYPFTLHAVPAGNDWQVDSIADVDALLSKLEQHSGMTH